MEDSILNYSKKPGELEGFSLLENKSYPHRKTHLFIGIIYPDMVIKDRNAYQITFIDESLTLQGFAITTYTEDNKISCINLFGDHPNCDPDTNAYCLPNQKVGMDLNNQTLSLLMQNFKTYYLDSAYFVPDSKDLEYEQLQSISIQFNSKES
jgi:hypothetical protein